MIWWWGSIRPQSAGSILNVDDTVRSVIEPDQIITLRWLADEQSRMESQAANLTINDTNITTAGIENLQQLFTELDNLDRVDKVNRTANDLMVRVLPDLMPPVQNLNIDNADTDVTALDIVVAMR